eukprot:TRINITY_DN24113_c0_g1_i1.p1 TRINITY_DN24113_c0_g1~~TRINITY_DN24113_c0_g1_i1.p1  ORF type:complete len:678 (+),score=160.65 TRINITY_DN24113_c0_g1_i1:76-2109(+)
MPATSEDGDRVGGSGPLTAFAPEQESCSVAPTSDHNQSADADDNSPGCWYFQEPTTQQPVGPLTVKELFVRFRQNQLDGCTLVRRTRHAGDWRPLVDVQELKTALQKASVASGDGTTEGNDDDEEGIPSEMGTDKRQNGETQEQPPSKRQRRTPMDDVPLTHTYTSDGGQLFIFDNVDEDWKASDIYEALVALEKSTAEKSKSLAALSEHDVAKSGNGNIDADQAMKELMAQTVGLGETMLLSEGDQAGPRLGQNTMTSKPLNTAAKGDDGTEKTAAVDSEPVDPETLAKRQKRRDYRERKKLKRQAGLFVKAQDNPNVYVSGLPADVTLQELEVVFKRAGVLKVDVESGNAKIRIYGDEKGCSGDALVSYANAASVELAVKFLHEFEFRPQCRICVQQADFEDHAPKAPQISRDDLKALAAARQSDTERAKYLAARSMQKEAVSWGVEMDDGSGRRIVVLRHMFSLEEAMSEGPEFYAELADEVKEECEKIGNVVKVTPMEKTRHGIVCVKFRTSAEAEECIRVMDGRFFAQRKVEAAFYDGVTNFRVFGVVGNDVGDGTSTSASPAVESRVTSADQPQAPVATLAQVGRDARLAVASVADSHGLAATAVEDMAAEPASADTTTVAGTDAGVTTRALNEVAPSPAQMLGAPSATFDDWLDNQSSDSDEEFKVRVEE